jgi:predicted peptidase
MKKFLVIILTFFSVSLFSQTDLLRQTSGEVDKEITVRVKLQYLVYLPSAYKDDNKKWPLVLFLHGAGERGSDLNFVNRNGPTKLVEEGKDFPFIMISPQCPLGQRWDARELSTLLDEIEKIYSVDKNKEYVTGLSMGGEGTWKLIMAEPDRFAAAAPVCGRTGSSYLDASKLEDLPLWIFHGAMDDVVSLDESVRMVKALEKFGNDVKFTVYPKANHNAWDETYNNEKLYNWLLEHSLNKNN